MKLRREQPGKRHNLPNMASMSSVQNTSSPGGSVRSKFCLPKELRGPKYGELMPFTVRLKQFTTGLVKEHVVFHSENPPNHLHDLHDYKSNEMTTVTYLDSEEANELQISAACSQSTPNSHGVPAELSNPPARNFPPH